MNQYPIYQEISSLPGLQDEWYDADMPTASIFVMEQAAAMHSLYEHLSDSAVGSGQSQQIDAHDHGRSDESEQYVRDCLVNWSIALCQITTQETGSKEPVLFTVLNSCVMDISTPSEVPLLNALAFGIPARTASQCFYCSREFTTITAPPMSLDTTLTGGTTFGNIRYRLYNPDAGTPLLDTKFGWTDGVGVHGSNQEPSSVTFTVSDSADYEGWLYIIMDFWREAGAGTVQVRSVDKFYRETYRMGNGGRLIG